MITVQNRRDEAIRAGFKALADRLPQDYSYDKFCDALAAWDVSAFCRGDDVVGMLMVKDDELHVAVLPEVRGRWLSRRLIRDVLGPLVHRYGHARSLVATGNAKGMDFTLRIGFMPTERGDIELLREGFERRYFDPVTALATATVASSLIGAGGSRSAANTAASAANRASDTQLQMFNTINEQQAPWRQAGETALGQIGAMQPQFTHQFGAEDLKTNLAPNYQFQLEQGLGAVKNAGNLQTGLLSGNTMRGINDYAQNYAGNAYQQAFNNYNAQQTNIFNRLSTIAGYGSTANQTSANAGAALASGAGNAQIAGGAAQAAGTIGQANAIGGGLTNLGWFTSPMVRNAIGGTGGGVSAFDPNQMT